ncbi:mitochondrial resolvase Ydc2, partial [Tirmania nivea]
MPVPPGLKLTPALLNSLKRAQLRAIASSLGTPISGTKKVLAERVCAALGRSRFPVIRSDGGGVMRVLSVDMGIRNLAVCLLEVPLRPGGEGGEGGGGREGREGWGMGGHSYRERDKYLMVPSVIAWRRMSVPPNEPPAPPQMPSPTPPAESFSASTFSHHAYNLAITLLGLSGPASQPHQILIETQRYRSHGGAAVLEWTLRVNMLENMLWGCLRTLAEVGYWGGESIEGVNPSKVAGFWEDWLVRNGVIGVEKLQTTYAESKKSKTRIVKGLLCAPCTQSSYSSSSASFDAGEGIPLFELVTDQARETAGLFLEVNENGNGSGVRKPIVDSGKRNKKQPKGKLDDLADCLLQGLAWVKWEEGRRR